MIGRQEERIDDQSMMTHVRMTEQTMIIERKKATQSNMNGQRQENMRQGQQIHGLMTIKNPEEEKKTP